MKINSLMICNFLVSAVYIAGKLIEFNDVENNQSSFSFKMMPDFFILLSVCQLAEEEFREIHRI